MECKLHAFINWTVFLVFMSWVMCGFIGFALDPQAKGHESISKESDSNSKNESDTTVSQKPPKKILVEVTKPLEDEEEETISVVNAVFSHSVAPATPELLQVPPSIIYAAPSSMESQVIPTSPVIMMKSVEAENIPQDRKIPAIENEPQDENVPQQHGKTPQHQHEKTQQQENIVGENVQQQESVSRQEKTPQQENLLQHEKAQQQENILGENVQQQGKAPQQKNLLQQHENLLQHEKAQQQENIVGENVQQQGKVPQQENLLQQHENLLQHEKTQQHEEIPQHGNNEKTPQHVKSEMIPPHIKKIQQEELPQQENTVEIEGHSFSYETTIVSDAGRLLLPVNTDRVESFIPEVSVEGETDGDNNVMSVSPNRPEKIIDGTKSEVNEEKNEELDQENGYVDTGELLQLATEKREQKSTEESNKTEKVDKAEVIKNNNFTEQYSYDGDAFKKTVNDSESFTSPIVEKDGEHSDKGKPKDNGMLSFTEWKKKLDEERDREREEDDIVDVSKLVSSKNKTASKKANKIKKNYASLECGAKVISANEEATNSISVLKEDKDAYMLNPCNVKAWFIVELCERIEIDSIDFANFEMFSSTPEIFVVYVSSRYPTREWEVAGTFYGKPEKDVQTYTFQERFYAKYIKIEIKKYFGKEHYCPLSLLRVFGITEVEQIEDEDENEHSSDDTSNNDESQQQDEKTIDNNDNIFTTAKKAVVGLVSGMAKKFSGQSEDKTRENEPRATNETKQVLVTLLPDSNVDFDDFHTLKVVSHFNISVNRRCRIWFDFVFSKHMCPNIDMTMNNTPYYHKHIFTAEEATKKEYITQTVGELKQTETLSNSESSSEENSVPPLAVPPLATTKSIKSSASLTKDSSRDTVKQSITSSESSHLVNKDIATTNEHEVVKPMCSKKTDFLDVRKVLQPTLQPSFLVAGTTTSALATQSPSTTQTEREVETQPVSYESSVTSSISLTMPQKFIDRAQDSVDVLEFKFNGTVDGEMVAEKIVENTTQAEKESGIHNTISFDNSLELKNIGNNEDVEGETHSKQKSVLTVTIKEDTGKISSTVTNQLEGIVLEMESLAASPSESMTTLSSLEQLPESTTLLTAKSSVLPSDINATAATYTPLTVMNSTPNEEIEDTAYTMESSSILATEIIHTDTADNAATSILSSATVVKTGLSGSKESVIVKLNAKVKALQANLTMSMMYLEDMSERYRAAVEEVDKRHEKKALALSYNLKSQQDMIDHQVALIANLTTKLEMLSKQILNLTTVTQEQNNKLFETQFTWMFIEIIVVLMLVLLCRRAPQQHDENRRRNSEPIMHYQHINGSLKRTYATSNGVRNRLSNGVSRNSGHIGDSSPNHTTSELSPNHLPAMSNCSNGIPHKKKKRRKSRSLDKQDQIQDKEAKVSKSAGLLFSAGNKLITGITGAFYGNKDAPNKPSLQAEALLDGNPNKPSLQAEALLENNVGNRTKSFIKTENHMSSRNPAKFFSKSKSIDLQTIEEINPSCLMARSCSYDVLINNGHKKTNRSKTNGKFHKSAAGRV